MWLASGSSTVKRRLQTLAVLWFCAKLIVAFVSSAHKVISSSSPSRYVKDIHSSDGLREKAINIFLASLEDVKCRGGVHCLIPNLQMHCVKRVPAPCAESKVHSRMPHPRLHSIKLMQNVMGQKKLYPHYWCISWVYFYKGLNLVQSSLGFFRKKKSPLRLKWSVVLVTYGYLLNIFRYSALVKYAAPGVWLVVVWVHKGGEEKEKNTQKRQQRLWNSIKLCLWFFLSVVCNTEWFSWSLFISIVTN